MLASLLLNEPVGFRQPGKPTRVYADRQARMEAVYAEELPPEVVFISPPIRMKEDIVQVMDDLNDDEDAVVFLTLLH